MPPIELPRALEEYFAFAETEPTRRGRRFSITLPVLNGTRLERLQWWYHVSPGQEQMFEGKGLAFLRADAIRRFSRHIERWLEINRQRLHGEEPIPRVSAVDDVLRQPVHDPEMAAAIEAALANATANSMIDPAAGSPPAPSDDPPESQPAPHSADILPWPLERIANG